MAEEHPTAASRRRSNARQVDPNLGQRAAMLAFTSLILLGVVLGYLGYANSGPLPITVEWVTANELNTAGFYVYRGEAPDQIDRLLNEKIIPAAVDPIKGGSYELLDPAVEVGKTYYYELREVDFEGKVARFGAITATTRQGGRVELILAVVSTAAGLLGLAAIWWIKSGRDGSQS